MEKALTFVLRVNLTQFAGIVAIINDIRHPQKVKKMLKASKIKVELRIYSFRRVTWQVK